MFRKYFGLGFQIPERSGFPEAVLGTGAVKSALPSFVRGTPGFFRFCHGANAGARASTAEAVAIAELLRMAGLYTRAWPGRVRSSEPGSRPWTGRRARWRRIQ